LFKESILFEESTKLTFFENAVGFVGKL